MLAEMTSDREDCKGARPMSLKIKYTCELGLWSGLHKMSQRVSSYFVFLNQAGSERAGDSCRGAKALRCPERLVNVRYFSDRHRLELLYLRLSILDFSNDEKTRVFVSSSFSFNQMVQL